jgi:anti-sigma-K factor RskA
VLVTSSHSTADGFSGDQTVIAPALTATDEELAEMIDRFRRAMVDLQRRIEEQLR